MLLRFERFVAAALLAGFSLLMFLTLLYSGEHSWGVAWLDVRLVAINKPTLYFELVLLPAIAVWSMSLAWRERRELRGD